jgi:TonB family protein
MVLMLAGLIFIPAVYAQSDQREVPKIVRKSGGVLASESVERVNPDYPPLAKAARVSGAVVVEVMIDEEGNVTSARAVSGHPLLRDSAVTAARGWRFKPTLLSGQPVKVVGTITFNYHVGNDEEIAKLEQDAAANPDSAEMQYKLAGAYRVNGRREEALAAYDRAVQIKPDHVDAWFDMAQLYEEMNDHDRALDTLNQALKVRPEGGPSGQIHDLIGSIYFKMGNYEEARDAFKKCLEFSPNFEPAHFQLGRTYLKLGDRDSAIEQYRILREKNPRFAELLLKEINGK